MFYRNKMFRVANAIMEAEGWKPATTDAGVAEGSKSYRNHNPGNLRESRFEVGNVDNFSVFENDDVGFYAIVHQLWLYASGRSSAVSPKATIAQTMALYNGLEQGSPAFNEYISIIEKVAGVIPSDPISSLLLND